MKKNKLNQNAIVHRKIITGYDKTTNEPNFRSIKQTKK